MSPEPDAPLWRIGTWNQAFFDLWQREDAIGKPNPDLPRSVLIALEVRRTGGRARTRTGPMGQTDQGVRCVRHHDCPPKRSWPLWPVTDWKGNADATRLNRENMRKSKETR